MLTFECVLKPNICLTHRLENKENSICLFLDATCRQFRPPWRTPARLLSLFWASRGVLGNPSGAPGMRRGLPKTFPRHDCVCNSRRRSIQGPSTLPFQGQLDVQGPPKLPFQSQLDVQGASKPPFQSQLDVQGPQNRHSRANFRLTFRTKR